MFVNWVSKNKNWVYLPVIILVSNEGLDNVRDHRVLLGVCQGGHLAAGNFKTILNIVNIVIFRFVNISNSLPWTAPRILEFYKQLTMSFHKHHMVKIRILGKNASSWSLFQSQFLVGKVEKLLPPGENIFIPLQ